MLRHAITTIDDEEEVEVLAIIEHLLLRLFVQHDLEEILRLHRIERGHKRNRNRDHVIRVIWVLRVGQLRYHHVSGTIIEVNAA